MDWDEVRTRAAQEFGKRWDAVCYRLGARSFDEQPAVVPQFGRFFFTAEQVPQILDEIRRRLPEEAGRIVALADRICRQEFDLLGYEGLRYGDPIDWHLDAASGKRAPRRPWHEIRYLDCGEVGDAKVTWELNRHQHLVTLAKAYRLTGDLRYTNELCAEWRHWQRENPYPIGINWASALEVGFRSLSWLWVWYLLEGTASVPREFPRELTHALALHGRHIERYLSTYFSPNTHLLGEGVALFFLGVLCPDLASAVRWRERGWAIVQQQAQRQVLADGMHFEQSTYYHVYALDFLLHARVLAAANGLAIPAELDATLRRMLDALCVLGTAGAPARFGDDDGGRVFDPQRNRAEHLLDPLATGAVLFGRGDYKAAARGLCEETLWLLGPGAGAAFDALPADTRVLRSGALEASGIYVLARADPEPAQATLRAGPMGALSAGHSHADALCVSVACGGEELLVDPGTYTYASAGAERNLFRGTAAHNTLVVDGAEQAEPGGVFNWRTQVEARADGWLAREGFDLVVARHAGYARLAQPVVHQRWVFHRKGGRLFFLDRVTGAGEHELELRWHLAPGVEATAEPGGVVVLRTPGGRTHALLTAGACAPHLEEGWYSPVYGRREACTVLVYHARARVPAEFATQLLLRPNVQVPERLELLNAGDAAAAATGYARIRPGAGDREYTFFATREGRWQVEDFASDARFVCCEVSTGGRVGYAAFWSGSFLEMAGRRVLATKGAVEWCEWSEGMARPRSSVEDAALESSEAGTSEVANANIRTDFGEGAS
jgi:uncharacterized heparinase superfamily protein